MNSEEDVVITIAAPKKKRKRKKTTQKSKNPRKKKSVWKKPWLLRRPSYGIYSTLIVELRIESQSSYKKVLRLTEDKFLEFFCFIENDLKKQDTKFRQAIPPNIKLAVTITLLA